MYTWFYITDNIWNNSFNYQKRKQTIWFAQIYVPELINWTLNDLKLWNKIVFEEIWNIWKIQSCIWLNSFIKLNNTDKKIVIFDNHNHSLYFWYERFIDWFITKNLNLIHIDQHSDMKTNKNQINLKYECNKSYIFDFVNTHTNVGNYIYPAINSWLINNIIQLRTLYNLVNHIELTESHKPENTILNIDIDIFLPNDPDYNTKINIIKSLINKYKYITIATSPYFIDQSYAIQIIKKII